MFFFTEIDLSKYSNLKLANVFLDPTGQHILLSLESKQTEVPSEVLYLSKRNSKLKHVSFSNLNNFVNL